MTTQAAIEISRWYLAGFFLFVAGVYLLRLVLARRGPVQRHVNYGPPGSIHWWLSLSFRVFRVTILGVFLARVSWPEMDVGLVPFPSFTSATTVIAGDVLLAACFGLVIYCNLYLGAAWRSGIPEGKPPSLITDGPFAWSRNPTFLGVQGAQLGLFLTFPSLFTLICLAAGWFVIQVQVRLEERHLAATVGPAYQAYCDETPRWLRLWPAERRTAAP